MSAAPFDLATILPFDDTVKSILGMPSFACIGIAQSLRVKGMNIDRKAEAEQAATIYYLLCMYTLHGGNFMQMVRSDLQREVKS